MFHYFCKICNFLAGSFSAVSKPNFTREYAFCSIFQNLPDSQAEIFEIWQNFAKFLTFAFFKFFLLKFHRNCWFFKPIFCENFEIAAVQKDANLVELEKCCRTHIDLQNLASIQPRTSPLKFVGSRDSWAPPIRSAASRPSTSSTAPPARATPSFLGQE